MVFVGTEMKRMSVMRILIDTEDRRNMMYYLPWASDGTCFNFKAPTKVIYPYSTIREPEKVETLVINCDLPSYEFISSMINLTQLYIYKGNNVADLGFLKSLVKLRQLCILDSHIKSLQSLVELIDSKYKCYKEFPEEEDSWMRRIIYGFEGVCIQSDTYYGDGSELLNDICSSDILVNKNRITFMDIMITPRYRKLIFGDE